MPLKECGPLDMGRGGLSKNPINPDRSMGHRWRGIPIVRRVRTNLYTPYNRSTRP